MACTTSHVRIMTRIRFITPPSCRGKNGFLNSLTVAATGKKVIALPIEATALGNLKIQMEAEA